jgi:hypothetical protein
MPRSKTDNPPAPEELSMEEADAIVGGGTTDMHIEPVVQFDNPIISKDTDKVVDG